MDSATKDSYSNIPYDDRQSIDERILEDFSRTRSNKRRWIRCFVWFLFGTAAGALFLKAVQDVPLYTRMGSPKARLQRLLRIPSEVTVFEPIDLFASLPSPTSNEAWNELLGPSRGFINLRNPETEYGLPPGRPVVEDPDSAVYGLTMFHQLHCVILIREIYYGLLLGEYNSSEYISLMESGGGADNHRGHMHDKSSLWFKIEHAKHCFDYLQQSIRCAGLMQIELPIGPNRNIFDGYGSPHTCKLWDNIMDFMVEHRVTDE